MDGESRNGCEEQAAQTPQFKVLWCCFSTGKALAGLTKTVALETAREEQVTCNAICPGYVLTDLVKNQLENTSRARGIPVVRPGLRVVFHQKQVVDMVYFYPLIALSWVHVE